MRNPLRYLIPFILILTAFASTGSADVADHIAQECNTADTQTEIENCSLESPSSSSAIYFAQQTPGTNAYRLHNPTKRTNHTHRNNVGFSQVCNTTSAGTGIFIKKESLSIRYFVEPTCMLISLGKLII